MQHLLRATSGPQAGAVYVLGRRTTLGRASDCDIQIVHEGVSRRHAKITQQDDGSMVVSDLSSDNGTFVDSERIQRHRLESGQELRIMRTRFTYERLESTDMATSAIFRRKITSGDSLRQTADHGKSLAAIRAGMAKPADSIGAAAGRPHSRPQAAAPAPSGARPGAPAVSVSSDEASVGSGEAVSHEPVQVRRPIPGGAEPFVGARPGGAVRVSEEDDGPPHHGRKTAPTRESMPPAEYTGDTAATMPRYQTGASVSLGSGTKSERSELRRPVPTRHPTPSPPRQDGSGSYGWHADQQRRGRREHVGGLPSATATHSRVERTPVATPAGRMAPSAPAGVDQPEPATPGPASTPAAPPSSSGGWARLPRSVEAPRSMRPGSTLSGLPRIEDDAEPPADSTPRTAPSPEPAPAPRRGITAEYGIAGEGGAAASDAEVATPVESTPSTTPASAWSSPPPAGATSESARTRTPEEDPDAVLDRMRTLPSIKRITDDTPRPTSKPTATLGSATPTEEVPRIVEPEPEPAESDEVDDDVYETLPRITINPEHALVPEPPVESETPATSEPKPRTGPRLVSPLSRPSEKLPYEDTLRFNRSKDRDGEESASSGVLQTRQHVTSDELIDALEELLPGGDEDEAEEAPSDPRSDALVLEPTPASMPQVGALIDAATEEGTWPSEEQDMSPGDLMGMRVQHVFELANRQNRHRRGLECLIDILEYRELRLRSLRGEAFDKERFAELQEQLQQSSMPGPDAASMRRYHRYICSIPAQLTHRERGTTSTISVEVEDLSAGGAKVTFGEYSIDSGDIVWLAFDLSEAEGRGTVIPDAQTVVFKARVVWARPHDAQLGLIFAGAPRYGDDAAVELES